MRNGNASTPLNRSFSRGVESSPSYQSLSYRSSGDTAEYASDLSQSDRDNKYTNRSISGSISSSLRNIWSSTRLWSSSGRFPTARLMDRDAAFFQSLGRWNIHRIKTTPGIKDLIDRDFFHTILNQDTHKIVFGLVFVYLCLVGCFAIVYLVISKTRGCELKLSSVRESYLFSLETMTTVGYGTNDYLFGTCWIMLPVLSIQACFGLLIDAVLIGLLFARLSRPQTRATTVVFSKNAVIRRVRGEAYFMFQVGELRKHQLLETHIRCYALKHEKLRVAGPGEDLMPDSVFFQCHNMRLQHPDDELGATLLLVVPQTVVHRIGPWSPMMPPPRWNSASGVVVQWGLHQDKDIVKAPWEHVTPPASPKPDKGDGFAEGGMLEEDGHPGGSNVLRKRSLTQHDEPGMLGGIAPLEKQAPSEGTSGSVGSEATTILRCENSYWDNEFKKDLMGGISRGDTNKGPGYVYRFPDLLKRWDDVDGDRGTWYENMKRRLLEVEKQRLQEVERKAKAEEEAAATAAKAKAKKKTLEGEKLDELSPLGVGIGGGSVAGTNLGKMRARPSTFMRRASIMHISGIDKVRSKKKTPLNELGRKTLVEMEEGGGRATTKHMRSQSTSTSNSNYTRSPPSMGSPSPPEPSQDGSPSPQKEHVDLHTWFANEERKAIDCYLQDRDVEVVVILEGIDTCTGNTVQCRHSYSYDDILWDQTFQSCVSKGDDGTCVVDYGKFHDTVPAPPDCLDHGFVQSYA